MTPERAEKIEQALLEYIEKYGLTEKARQLYQGKETSKASMEKSS